MSSDGKKHAIFSTTSVDLPDDDHCDSEDLYEHGQVKRSKAPDQTQQEPWTHLRGQSVAVCILECLQCLRAAQQA
jgi:hypothetical protein